MIISNHNKKKKKGGPYPGWHDFVAGAAAGAGARMITHPLDLIRIRRQLAAATWNTSDATTPTKPTTTTTMWQDMVRVVQTEGGIRGLFRGNVAALNLWVTYTAVQFYSYGLTKKYFQSTLSSEDSPTLIAFCSGASAGVAATVTTYPLDLCRTIFAAKGTSVELDSSIAAAGEKQLKKSSSSSTNTASAAAIKKSSSSSSSHEFRPPKNTIEFATNLYQRRGWKGFYAGCAPTVLQIIPYMGCSFAIYDGLTRGEKNVGLSAYAGSIAGAVSKALVYPMDTIKKRMQAQAFFGTSSSSSSNNLQPQQARGGPYYYVGVVDCAITIYKVEGIWSFYNGLVPSVLKTALAAGFSFAFFRGTKNLLESIHDQPFSTEDPPTRRSITRRMTTGR